MSLHETMIRLERRWSLDAHRNPPWARWSAHSPALDLDPTELRRRLVSRDRALSGEPLAALVELASRHDDRQAAELVTLTLLPRMVAAEQRGFRDTYEQLAGLLWEAIVTAPNPQASCLRESIERNVWRRMRRTERRVRAISLDANGVDLDRTRVVRRRGDDDPTPDAARDLRLLGRLHALVQERAITPTTHRILLHIVDGTDTVTAGQSAAAARKQRLRTLTGLKRSPAVCDALIA